MANEKIARAWLEKASLDLRLAKLVADAQPSLAPAAVFHCQQAAEKAIKAFLAFHRVRFEKTHDLGKLTDAVSSIEKNINLGDVDLLTKYAIAYRYPDAAEKPLDLAALKDAIRIAEIAMQEIVRSLPSLKLS